MLKQVLKQSFKIIWRYPSLWFLGFFATLFLLSANEFVLISMTSSFYFLETPMAMPTEFGVLPEPAESVSFLFILFLSSILVFLLFLSTYAEIIFTFLVKRKYKKEEKTPLLKKAFNCLFRVLKLRIMEVVAFFIILTGLYFVFYHHLPFSLAFFALFLIFLLMIIILFIARFSIFYILFKDNALFFSLKNSLSFLKRNWLKTLRLSFLLFLIVFLYGFISLSLLEGGVFSYPLRLFNFLLSYLIGAYGFWLMGLLTLFFTLFIQLIIIGLITAFQLTCWIIFFLTKTEELVDNNIILKEWEL